MPEGQLLVTGSWLPVCWVFYAKLRGSDMLVASRHCLFVKPRRGGMLSGFL